MGTRTRCLYPARSGNIGPGAKSVHVATPVAIVQTTQTFEAPRLMVLALEEAPVFAAATAAATGFQLKTLVDTPEKGDD